VFNQIKRYVKNTHAPTHDTYTLKIRHIFHLERPVEAQQFEEFKDMKNQQLLWHGSRATNFLGILSQGLRIAPPEAPTTGYMFGKGIYFADMVSKSANYCHASVSNPHGCLILCQVALGKCSKLKAANNAIARPPKPYNSTKGLGGTAPDPTQSEIEAGSKTKCSIPLGKCKSTGITDSELLYNEFVVYNEGQCMMRYLVMFDFKFK